MEVGPPGSPCRRSSQTAAVSCRSRAGVGSDCGKGPPSAGQVRDEKTNGRGQSRDHAGRGGAPGRPGRRRPAPAAPARYGLADALQDWGDGLLRVLASGQPARIRHGPSPSRGLDAQRYSYRDDNEATLLRRRRTSRRPDSAGSPGPRRSDPVARRPGKTPVARFAQGKRATRPAGAHRRVTHPGHIIRPASWKPSRGGRRGSPRHPPPRDLAAGTCGPEFGWPGRRHHRWRPAVRARRPSVGPCNHR
jgi:hypothetical protein